MDPIEILTNKEHIVPYFQPIFSADTQEVIGYEVLGRIHLNNEVVSLGSFFQDENVPEEYHVEVDDYVVIKALEEIVKYEDKNVIVFLNRNPNYLMSDHGEGFLQTLLSFENRGLNLKQIVLEITEHNFNGDLENLNHVLLYYKTYGIQIAIDNVGKEGSNLDRLRFLNPDILKVDLQILKQTTAPQTYQDVFQSLSLLARKIGATLLYEDIEANYQLQYAWKNNGRFYQGFFLAEPADSFIDKEFCKSLLKDEFHRYILHEKRKLQARFQITEQLTQRMKNISLKLKGLTFDEMIEELAIEFKDVSFRIYICDEDGFQVSANIIKSSDGNWELLTEYRNKNWSWRPYFLENIVRMNYVQKGILSDLYTDIEKDEIIRTFSYPLDEAGYVFIDLPYEYIFEHDGLLF